MQGDIQAAVRALTGTSLSYEGDWHALFDRDQIPAGDFNGRLLAWLVKAGMDSAASLNGAMVQYALSKGVPTWGGLSAVSAILPPVAFPLTVEPGNSVTNARDMTTSAWNKGFVSSGTVTREAPDTVAFSGGPNQQMTSNSGINRQGTYRLEFKVQRIDGTGDICGQTYSGNYNVGPYGNDTVTFLGLPTTPGAIVQYSKDVVFPADSTNTTNWVISNRDGKPARVKFLPNAFGDLVRFVKVS